MRSKRPPLDPPSAEPGRSRPVISAQLGVHPGLDRRLQRHWSRPSERPIAAHTLAAWAELERRLAEAPERPIVLDAGCGTGESSHRLAQMHPAAWILGVDRSAHRLGRAAGVGRRGDRILLARAELGDLWRQMARAGVTLGAHYLLYPNPWPKKRHLVRRIHGDPAFFDLLALGGRLVARSNWPIYLEELAWAIRWVTGASARPRRLEERGAPLTPFERKYRASGHDLFELQVCLRPRSGWPDQQGVAAVHASTEGNRPLENS